METEVYTKPLQRFYAKQSIFITGIYTQSIINSK